VLVRPRSRHGQSVFTSHMVIIVYGTVSHTHVFTTHGGWNDVIYLSIFTSHMVVIVYGQAQHRSREMGPQHLTGMIGAVT
jgi:hypothetical protein